jgi:hypothetical protein
MVSELTLLRITAHYTPHSSDPPDAHEFYAALGMFTVAWGRFEGHMTGALLQILAMPEASTTDSHLPILCLTIAWKKRAILWKAAFKTTRAVYGARNSVHETCNGRD